MNNNTVSIPPQAPDVERAVISAMLNEPDCFEEIIGFIDAETFYKSEHRIIFLTALHLWQEKETFDYFNVLERLKSNGSIDTIGGDESFWGFVEEYNSPAGIKNWCEILTEKRKLRDLDLLSRTIKNMVDDGRSSRELIEHIIQSLDFVSEDGFSNNIHTMSDIISKAYEVIKERSEAKAGITGIPTGFKLLDDITAGWQNDNFIIIGGPTKQGKSSLAITFALAAAKNNFPVVIYSMEMSAIELVERFIAHDSQIETAAVHYKKPSQSQWERMSNSCQMLHDYPLIFDTSPGLKITELSAKAKLIKKRSEIKLVIVDYIHLMSGHGESSRQLQVENISRGLKKLAMSLHVPVIAISQFSRAQKGQENRRPMLSDLRDSGALEQDANLVLMIHDPSNERKKKHLDTMKVPYADVDLNHLREIIVAANRQGPKNDILVKWYGEFFRFSDVV